MRRINSFLFFCAFTTTLGGNEAPYVVDKSASTQAVKSMQYQLANQDSEISYIKEKLASFETVLDSTHKEVSGLISQAKDAVKKSNGAVDTHIQTIEKNIEKLVSDLKAFKKQANELASNISDLQKNLKVREEVAELQAQQIKDLEQAMRLLASALQTKAPGVSSQSGKTYQVKTGDTLEKIAKELDVSVSSLKAENNLQKDVIYPGQKLKIP